MAAGVLFAQRVRVWREVAAHTITDRFLVFIGSIDPYALHRDQVVASLTLHIPHSPLRTLHSPLSTLSTYHRPHR